MNNFKKYIFILFTTITIIILLFLYLNKKSKNCNSNQIIENNSNQADSLFLLYKFKDIESKRYELQHREFSLQKVYLYKNLTISKIKDPRRLYNHKDKFLNGLGNPYSFFIKEYDSAKIKRSLYFFDDFKYFTIPDYDKKYSDFSILNDTSYIKEKPLSKNLFLIPLSRKTDTVFQNNMKKRTDINKLEKLVNNLSVTNKENIKRRYYPSSETEYLSLYRIIKKLFIITQMQTLNNNYMAGGCYVDPLSTNNVYEIKNSYDLKAFKLLTADTISYDLDKISKKTVSDSFIPVREYWDLLNKRFLAKKLKEIEDDYIGHDSVTYFYSYPDLKLMKLEIIDTGNGKIKLKKEYINKEYLWTDYYFGIPINYPVSY